MKYAMYSLLVLGYFVSPALSCYSYCHKCQVAIVNQTILNGHSSWSEVTQCHTARSAKKCQLIQLCRTNVKVVFKNTHLMKDMMPLSHLLADVTLKRDCASNEMPNKRWQVLTTKSGDELRFSEKNYYCHLHQCNDYRIKDILLGNIEFWVLTKCFSETCSITTKHALLTKDGQSLPEDVKDCMKFSRKNRIYCMTKCFTSSTIDNDGKTIHITTGCLKKKYHYFTKSNDLNYPENEMISSIKPADRSYLQTCETSLMNIKCSTNSYHYLNGEPGKRDYSGTFLNICALCYGRISYNSKECRHDNLKSNNIFNYEVCEGECITYMTVSNEITIYRGCKKYSSLRDELDINLNLNNTSSGIIENCNVDKSKLLKNKAFSYEIIDNHRYISETYLNFTLDQCLLMCRILRKIRCNYMDYFEGKCTLLKQKEYPKIIYKQGSILYTYASTQCEGNDGLEEYKREGFISCQSSSTPCNTLGLYEIEDKLIEYTIYKREVDSSIEEYMKEYNVMIRTDLAKKFVDLYNRAILYNDANRFRSELLQITESTYQSHQNCSAGWEPRNGVCIQCSRTSFKETKGTDDCEICKQGFIAEKPGSTKSSDCKLAICNLGWRSILINDQTGCIPCPLNYYQDELYKKTCKRCPNNSKTVFRATNSSQFCYESSRVEELRRIARVNGESQEAFDNIFKYRGLKEYDDEISKTDADLPGMQIDVIGNFSNIIRAEEKRMTEFDDNEEDYKEKWLSIVNIKNGIALLVIALILSIIVYGSTRRTSFTVDNSLVSATDSMINDSCTYMKDSINIERHRVSNPMMPPSRHSTRSEYNFDSIVSRKD